MIRNNIAASNFHQIALSILIQFFQTKGKMNSTNEIANKSMAKMGMHFVTIGMTSVPCKTNKLEEKAIPTNGKHKGKVMTTINSCLVFPWLDRNAVKQVIMANPKLTNSNKGIHKRPQPLSMGANMFINDNSKIPKLHNKPDRYKALAQNNCNGLYKVKL